MKNIRFFFSCLAVAIISIIIVHNSTVSQVSAQCPPPPDCFSDLFVPGPPIVIVDGGCTITVTWCWRIACGIWNDFVITSITSSGICPGALTSLQIQEEALKEAIKQNPWGATIPPCPQQSQVTWRLSKLACVAEYEIIGSGGMTLLWPCEPVSYCWEMLTSCYEFNPINGNRTIKITIVSSFSTIPCSQTAPSQSIPFEVILRSNCYETCN